MKQFDVLKLVMFSGKGGVGKTTLSCGFARRWARQFPTQRILLISTDPAHSLGDVLQMTVEDAPQPMQDYPNLGVRSLDAANLLKEFKNRYGTVLELLVERGSFVQNEDLTPVWDLSFPGLDELMSILEIQRILREGEADRVVVDMAPSGHTLNLFGLMDFLDEFLNALELFQEKHRVIKQSFTGHYNPDATDEFLQMMKADLADGRRLLQAAEQTACLVVAIAEPMSFLETQRFLTALQELQIPWGGVFLNQIVGDGWEAGEWERREDGGDRADVTSLRMERLDLLHEQQILVSQFLTLANQKPLLAVPRQGKEPVGGKALDALIEQVWQVRESAAVTELAEAWLPEKVLPGFGDFVHAGRRLLIVGGKGGVGKTTVAAAIAWGMASQHPDRSVRVISIDPAHSLGDAFGMTLGHEVVPIAPNLTAQEVDAEQVLEQFRAEYLWELAEMMSGESGDGTLKIAYGPEAWRRIVSQALPGIDEMLSLVAVMDLLEAGKQDLIILDTAPTGHLLRFLEMPQAISDWLAWIFKLWIKYQNVLGRTDFMGRLRSLRQRVVNAQKKLKDPQYTELIGVVLSDSAVIAEAQRLSLALEQMGMAQRYIVQNRFIRGHDLEVNTFPERTIVRLPVLPRSIAPQRQIETAAHLLF